MYVHSMLVFGFSEYGLGLGFGLNSIVRGESDMILALDHIFARAL